MHAFRTVQFAPEVHIILAVYLFDLDNGKSFCPENIQNLFCIAYADESWIFGIIFFHTDKIFLLYINNEQCAFIFELHFISPFLIILIGDEGKSKINPYQNLHRGFRS